MNRFANVFILLALAAGCGQADKSGPPSSLSSSEPAKGSEFVLAAEPAGAQGVLEIRDKAKNGDDVVVVGKVGGSKEPLVKGLAAFSIVDLSLKTCDANPDDKCETPWDYCCVPDVDKALVMIEFVDAQGKTIRQDARDLLGIKELQTVVLRGKAQRDAKDNLTIVASGLYVRQQ